jgi:hypothetical protein
LKGCTQLNGNVQNGIQGFASTIAGNYASNVPNSYANLKVGYAARLFYGDAFIANQKSTGGVHFW